MDEIKLTPIGYVRTDQLEVPRFHTISDLQGELVIQENLQDGIADIEPGSSILVLFYFHESPAFTSDKLRIMPPSRSDTRGVFSTRSPVRPNPLGLSKLLVSYVRENRIGVRGLDMIDGTPILDIKPDKTTPSKLPSAGGR